MGENPLNGNGTPLPFWEGEEMIQSTKQFEDLEGREAEIVNTYEKIAANLQIDFA